MRSKTIESIRILYSEEVSRVQPSGKHLDWNGSSYKSFKWKHVGYINRYIKISSQLHPRV